MFIVVTGAAGFIGANLVRALNERGERTAFWIIGMGKAGARELNVSSDIDLIYLYDDAGDAALQPAVEASLGCGVPTAVATCTRARRCSNGPDGSSPT